MNKLREDDWKDFRRKEILLTGRCLAVLKEKLQYFISFVSTLFIPDYEKDLEEFRTTYDRALQVLQESK